NSACFQLAPTSSHSAKVAMFNDASSNHAFERSHLVMMVECMRAWRKPAACSLLSLKLVIARSACARRARIRKDWLNTAACRPALSKQVSTSEQRLNVARLSAVPVKFAPSKLHWSNTDSRRSLPEKSVLRKSTRENTPPGIPSEV